MKLNSAFLLLLAYAAGMATMSIGCGETKALEPISTGSRILGTQNSEQLNSNDNSLIADANENLER